MSIVTYANWRIEAEAERTKRTVKAIRGKPETCPCDWCNNFSAAAMSLYPKEVKSLLDAFSVDATKPSEVYAFHQNAHSLAYRWWFHFYGRILEGSDSWTYVDEKDLPHWKQNLEVVSEKPWFALGFTTNYKDRNESRHIPEGFDKRRSILQIEFRAEVPWVLSIPMPRLGSTDIPALAD